MCWKLPSASLVDNKTHIDYCQYVILGPKCANCFLGLSCKKRVEIINFLKKVGVASVKEITDQFSLSQPTITHHLKYLLKAEIVSSERKGKYVFYKVNPKCGKDLCNIFR